VKPEYRRKGICSAMMNVVEATAVENQISRIVCTVQAKNDSAIQFLAAHHFSYCGYQEFYFPNLEIALFFAKNIR
jgi:ribosomal protein S18 acetylase RimI-like enzyme